MEGEFRKMTENTVELIKLILDTVDVERAVLTAAAIISDLLKQHESDQVQAVAFLPAVSQMNTSF